MAVLRHAWRLVLAGLFIATTITAYATGSLQLQEQEIKAGLLYNFLKYTDWPANASNPSTTLTICTFHNDPFATYLQPMAGRTVNQREIMLRNIQNTSDATDCHLLIIHTTEREDWQQLQQFLKGKSILTVGDFKTFAASGGMIEFGQKENRVHVNLNLQALTAAGLHVQDRLLKLVTLVPSESPKGP